MEFSTGLYMANPPSVLTTRPPFKAILSRRPLSVNAFMSSSKPPCLFTAFFRYISHAGNGGGFNINKLVGFDGISGQGDFF